MALHWIHLNLPDLLAFSFLLHDGHSNIFGKQDWVVDIPRLFKPSSKLSTIVKNLEKPNN
jgi:hypothetical protein